MPVLSLDLPAGGLRVLVAEDDPVSRHRLHAALSSWGYDVTTGQCHMNPTAKVMSYEVKVEGSDVQVAV